MSTNKPLHTYSNTHLYAGSFPEFTAQQLSDEAEVLVAPRSDSPRA